ncbi:MAG: sulfite reductase, beta subunit (hemoprotein) [Actinomycetia bacterium]|jgi:sulfite reductase (ferredoxin)|nr:sulfite reductase, beta subunit (hemoprotein) [Actinomycetes bacterium]
MAIDVRQLQARDLSPEFEEDVVRFETTLGQYLDGRIEEDVFRVFRLGFGVYGQRQGGRNQMLRVKIPYGRTTPEQLEVLGYISETYSRGWGHLTTRQNVQFHFVQLEEMPEILRLLASVGMTTREACGDTVRNVVGCHLAGACPFEVLDISAWADATAQYFLRHPYAQRLPRKFKINFSGCATDCGQAMFNDVGVVAVNRPRPDGTVEAGFRVFIAGGLGANPHPAQALEEFTAKEDLLPTLEAVLRTFDHYGNRDNKLRARLKWLVDTMGIDELRQRIIKERKFLLASRTWPGGIPEIVRELGDAPAGGGTAVSADGGGVPVKLLSRGKYERWEEANVVRGIARGTVSAYAHAVLGDITADQFRALADIQRDFDLDVRITNRQNFVLRDLTEGELRGLFDRLDAIGMAEAGAELARDVVSCPGADTCNLAVTQSRGLASDIDRALEEAGLADVGGIKVNISGCTNSCGQHHISDIGFFGLERRAHGRAAPGYQMLLGGHLGNMEVAFGQKALKVPAKAAAEAVVRVVGRFANEREAGEVFATWLERSGGASQIGKELADLDHFPTPEEAPDYYVDFDETGPYVAEVGDGECAAT